MSWFARFVIPTPRVAPERLSTALSARRGEVEGRWERVRDGWPDPPGTIAPLLIAGSTPGELWAADERGVHRSDDSGKSWRRIAGYAAPPHHLRGLALLQ